MSEVKFGEICGVELTKGLYQQLPLHKDYICVTIDDSEEAFCWEPELTIQGMLNWCPPKCEEIEGRDHRHLFLLVDGSPCQGFIYTDFRGGDAYPVRRSILRVWRQIHEEGMRLLRERAADTHASTGQKKAHLEREARIAEIEKAMVQYGETARHEINSWLEQAFAKLPLLLLRF